MAFTAILGTPQSVAGALQPGFVFQGVAIWRGPFATAEVLTDSGPRQVQIGQAAPVSLARAQQLIAADPGWWEAH